MKYGDLPLSQKKTKTFLESQSFKSLYIYIASAVFIYKQHTTFLYLNRPQKSVFPVILHWLTVKIC